MILTFASRLTLALDVLHTGRAHRAELAEVPVPSRVKPRAHAPRCSGEMECDLAVERGLGLEDGQEDFRESPQCIKAMMREMGFEVGSQRLSMQSGGI